MTKGELFNRRALFLDRQLSADLKAMDVTTLRLQSLAVQIPPWGFQEVAGHPTELSEEGVPQAVLLETECEACFGSFKGSGDARVKTPQTDGDSVQIGSYKSVQLVVRSMETETGLIVTCCHQFVVGFVVIDPVILVKFTFHLLSVVLSAMLNLAK